MTSTHALELTSQILQDPANAGPLLCLLYAVAGSHGDPLAEAMARDVMLFCYSKHEHCETSMLSFISEDETRQTQKAA